MDVYILDDNLRRTEVIDRFESLIWTERFQSYGEFELTINSSQSAKNLFTYGTKLLTNKSNRIMQVDEVEDKTDTDGTKRLTVKGSSIERVLQDRVLSYSANQSTTNLVYIEKGPVVIYTSSYNNLLTLNTTQQINHHLLTGDSVYFKSTASLPSRFTGYVNTIFITDNTFKLAKHGFYTGDQIYMTTTGTMPTGITSGTTYYVIVVNENLFKLALTLSDSENEIPIDITAIGSGVLSVYSKLLPWFEYFVIYVSPDTFKLADSFENAKNGVYLVIEGAQTGVDTLYWQNLGKLRISGLPADICRYIFDQFCVQGLLSSTDIIPFSSLDTINDTGSILEPDFEVTFDFKITTVYDAIKQLCDIYGLGFRIIYDYVTNEMLFNVYTGNDKTNSQTAFSPVVFDTNLDNLHSDTEYISVKNKKNVAYVFSKYGFSIVYSGSADATTSGFNKRVLYVDASDIEIGPGAILTNQLSIRGQQALSEYKTILAFDGELPSFGTYVYGVDYQLGDLVEVRNSYGYSDHKRVTEQIFSDDIEGEKSYPTLSSEQVITPGSWLAWSNTQTWNDVPDDLDNEWQDL